MRTVQYVAMRFYKIGLQERVIKCSNASGGRAGKLGAWAGIALTVSNMVGTGAFTSLGYQVEGDASIFSVVMLWLLGGFTAFCGAVSYHSLIQLFPDSGGETYFVARLYGRVPSIIVAVLSIVFGFAAPIALSAVAFASYLLPVVGLQVKGVASLAIVLVSAVHLMRLRTRGAIQGWLSLGKILILLAFIIGFFFVPKSLTVQPDPANINIEYFFTAPFAIALVFVHYAYSGWNTSVYVFRELKDTRTVYFSLFVSVVLITLLYTALNAIFFLCVEKENLQGVTEVGSMVAEVLFGSKWGHVLSSAIGILLIANVSAMIWAGSQVSQKTQELVSSKLPSVGKPFLHLISLATISLLFVWWYEFGQLLLITSCILSLISVSVVVRLVSLRNCKNEAVSITWKTKTCAIFYCVMMFSSSVTVLLTAL
ncbi:amino acid permease [Sphingobacterium olei]|uniref:Amino acid permease n=1 Tax=Sphingobacterium olei TaxID=2571155 RepID=A0A4U0NCU0_9SPHI|nr:amino acid permease [Sphingobacterium olei]TJZ51837.1 amino acid permease [Sphingobacterium olei]